jgi:hypothetical protein
MITNRHQLTGTSLLETTTNPGWPSPVPPARVKVSRLITDEGVAVGGAFNGDTATGMMPVAHRVVGLLASR